MEVSKKFEIAVGFSANSTQQDIAICDISPELLELRVPDSAMKNCIRRHKMRNLLIRQLVQD